MICNQTDGAVRAPPWRIHTNAATVAALSLRLFTVLPLPIQFSVPTATLFSRGICE